MTSLANLSSSEIAKAVRLAKKKEALQKELSRVEAELASLGGGTPAPARRGRKPGPKPGAKKAAAKKAPAKKAAKKAAAKKAAPAATAGKKRGALKTKIVSALKAAGPGGVSVKDLADKLKVKTTNVYSWFYTTGAKYPGVKKVGPGKYALQA